jgi:hypothetical protein
MRTLQDRPFVSDLPPPDAEVLIEEARRRQRRRWTVIAIVGLLVVGLVVGVVSAFGGSPPPSNGTPEARSHGQPPAQAASATHVSHVEIPVISPQTYTTGTLGASGGQVFIGSVFGTRCQLTTVVATTLRVVSNRPASCNNPLLYGEDVMPVESVVPIGSQYGAVRIAVRNPATGLVHLGPVVARYGNFSDSRPEWTYGGGYLWLYDVGTDGFTSKPPRLPVEVLKISATSGKVLASAAMPALSRIELAANDDGLWFAPSSETGFAAHTRPAMLYFLPTSTSRPEVILRKGQYVNWLVASGHTAWANISVDGPEGTAMTVTVTSPASKPLAVTNPAKTPSPSNVGEGPADAPAVLYAPGFGLIAALPGRIGTLGTVGASSEQIVKLDPSNGQFSKVASFGTPEGTVDANVVYGGALYVLIGAERSSHATLYRVPL